MTHAAHLSALKTRILYIDDDEALCVLLRKNLGRQGFDVISALDGRTGLAILEQGDVDAIALDHYLLGETGLDILPDILKQAGHPPVVYVTGAGDTGIAVEALKRGAEDYVTKNMSTDFFALLAVALNQAIERAHLRRERDAQQVVIRQERDRAELMLREVNHRIGNSLSLATALIRLQTSLMTDPAAIRALNETQVRLNAIGNVHRHLYVNNQLGTVRLDTYLASLLDELQSSMHDELRPCAIVLSADAVQLPTDKVVMLGLVISELVTNAFKYAYGAGVAGEIRVKISELPDQRVKLVVEDDGAGIQAADPPRGTGLGTKILAAMASSLGSRLTYDEVDRQGTRAEMLFSI